MTGYFSWLGGSGPFGTKARWADQSAPTSTGQFSPGSADIADFSAAVPGGTDITGTGAVSMMTVEGSITLDASIAANYVSNTGTIVLASGALTASWGLITSGTLDVTGGTLATANLISSGSILLSGGKSAISSYFGDDGTLSATAGGQISATNAAIGDTAGSRGSAMLSGSGSLLSVGATLLIGDDGTGTLQLGAGASASAQSLLLGVTTGANGSFSASGTNTIATIAQSATFGYAGDATASILGGASLDVGGSLDIATLQSASASLVIDGAASSVLVQQELADGAGGTGTITVSDSASLDVSGDIVLGVGYGAKAANGTLAVQSGGIAQSPVVAIGYGAGTTGKLTVSGQGSRLVATSALYVGPDGGTGSLNVSGAGTVSAGAAIVAATGSVLLSNGTFGSASLTNQGAIAGSGAISGSAAGQPITNTSSITASGGTLEITGAIGGTGTITIASGATLRLQGAVGTGQTVAFGTGTMPETLALGAASLIQAPITGFIAGDTIELEGVTAASASYQAGILTISGAVTGNGSVPTLATLAVSGSGTAGGFTIQSDGQGDSLITTKSPVASPPAPGSTVSQMLENENFFAPSSIWNTPIGSGHTYRSIPGFSNLLGGLSTWSSGNVAIYYAKSTDPLVPILYNSNTWYEVATGAWRQTGNSAAVEKQIIGSDQSTNPIPGNPYSTQVNGRVWNSNPSGLPASFDAWHQTPGQTLYAYVPAGATPPANDSDGQTVFIQPNGTAIELYAPVVLSSGAWASEMFATTNAATGLGTGVEDGRRASMIENYAGALRDTDVTKGSINHALAITVPASQLARGFTGPALAFDANSPDYSGTLPMGSRLALPPNLSLTALGLQSSLGLEIAHAAQTYGLFVVDRGGSGVTVVTQNAPTTSALAHWTSAEQHDLNAIVQASQSVF